MCSISQIGDGQIQAATAEVLSASATVASPTYSPAAASGQLISQIGDGQIQAPTGTPQAPVAPSYPEGGAPALSPPVAPPAPAPPAPASNTTSNATAAAPSSSQPAIETSTGGAGKLGSSVVGLLLAIGAVGMLL